MEKRRIRIHEERIQLAIDFLHKWNLKYEMLPKEIDYKSQVIIIECRDQDLYSLGVEIGMKEAIAHIGNLKINISE